MRSKVQVDTHMSQWDLNIKSHQATLQLFKVCPSSETGSSCTTQLERETAGTCWGKAGEPEFSLFPFRDWS